MEEGGTEERLVLGNRESEEGEGDGREENTEEGGFESGLSGSGGTD